MPWLSVIREENKPFQAFGKDMSNTRRKKWGRAEIIISLYKKPRDLSWPMTYLIAHRNLF